jgi:SHAQKYF class myb-like DNA-binding protein
LAQNGKAGRWTDQEHDLFLEALKIYGKDWENIERHVGTRDVIHVRSHAQKFLQKLKKLLEEGNKDADTRLYYEILHNKMTKPIKRKRKK